MALELGINAVRAFGYTGTEIRAKAQPASSAGA
jgi:hypothetical protein